MTAVAGRAALLATVTEAQWQRQVITWAKRGGWLVHHIHDSRNLEWGTDAGVPDLLLVHPERHRVYFVELKTQRGRVTLQQTAWITALRNVEGVQAAVWRPGDEDTVKRVLGL